MTESNEDRREEPEVDRDDQDHPDREEDSRNIGGSPVHGTEPTVVAPWHLPHLLVCETCGAEEGECECGGAYEIVPLHDPDCPMTNRDREARTSCVCDDTQWADTEAYTNRTVPEGGPR